MLVAVGRSLVFSYPTVHTQQSSVPTGVAEHNVTVARAFTKLMGAFVTFWDNDAGSKIHLLANPGQDVAPIGAARQEDSSRCWQGRTTTRCATSTSAVWATCAAASLRASRPSACPRCPRAAVSFLPSPKGSIEGPKYFFSQRHLQPLSPGRVVHAVDLKSHAPHNVGIVLGPRRGVVAPMP